MCFLNPSILSRFSDLFEAIFHIRLPLIQRACVSYLEVLVSGNFNNCLFWRSYLVFLKLKKSFMVGWLKLCIGWYISVNNDVCYFLEHSASYLLIADLRHLHLPFHITSAEYVRVYYLFDWSFIYRTS